MLRGLHDRLVAAVHAGGLPQWRPNEIFVRRYHPGGSGMSAHQNGLRFRLLVATLTVLGSATFHACDERGRPRRSWPLHPGDLVLLRAAALDGPPSDATGDNRPHHAIDGPGGTPRWSVVFRMSAP